MNLFKSTFWVRLITVVLLTSSLNACAKEDTPIQPASEQKPVVQTTPSVIKPLTEAEIDAKYRTCPSGYYSGSQPGKTYYAKDPFMWVVTPEFAKRLCLPEAFISSELKGAEAVAFRILNKNDEVNCGFGGNATACAGEKVLRFEIYIKSDVKLPRLREGRTYQAISMPSKMLLSMSETERKIQSEMVKNDPVSASLPHFARQQVGLVGFKDGKGLWPIAALSQEAHRGGTFEGIDYYSFEGTTGFFDNPRMQKLGIKQFFITFEKDSKVSRPKDRDISESAHVIELPTYYTDKIAELDRLAGHPLAGLMKKPPTTPSATTDNNSNTK